jgi:glycosyltransferase involved in cell wall biosynthesis
MKVAVVTPTIASEHLAKCIDSVDKQTYQDLTHYIFIDGCQYEPKAREILVGSSRTRMIELEENVGKGWYGHRVYAACSFLVNADVIIYLDEDNFLEPCHVQKMVDTLKEGNHDWVYSLRKIVDSKGEFICEDNCESLGKWPVYFDDKVFHIDTSCFAIRRDIAVHIGHAWYGQWGADRQFFNALKQHFKNFECTNAHTVNYRLDGNPNSVTKAFFEEGNAINKTKYNSEFPWKTKQRLLQVAPGISVLI